MKKTTTILGSLCVISLIFLSCGKKPTLEVKYDSKNWKSQIESYYEDSTDKKNQEILSRFITDVKNGVIMNSPYQTKEDEMTRFTYKELLDQAVPYDKYKKDESAYAEKIKSVLECKITKVGESEFTYEMTNKGQSDMLTCLIDLVIKNKSGEILYEISGQELNKKAPKNSTTKIVIGMLSAERVAKMDINTLDINLSIMRADFADGTTLKHPWQVFADTP